MNKQNETNSDKQRKQKKQKAVLRWILNLSVAGLSFLVLVSAGLAWMLYAPISRNQPIVDAHITAGLGARAIAKELRSQGLMVEPNLFSLVARFTGSAGHLKAGRYEVPEGLSVLGLIDFLSRGKGVLNSVTLIEGFTSAQHLQQLRKRTDLVDDLLNLGQFQIAKRYKLQGDSLEGWLYPDTYRYAPGSNLSHLIERAVRLQKEELNKAWASRASNLPLKTPYDVLILASIIEKETGSAKDRPVISSVFVNRLNRGMLLQTDPTVIYGVENFDGNLTRKHLRTDTPFNTYTRPGLPPTPIANPGQASLYAAVRPEETQFFYFVAKGNGESYFSKTLREHNRAVRRYQLGL